MKAKIYSFLLLIAAVAITSCDNKGENKNENQQTTSASSVAEPKDVDMERLNILLASYLTENSLNEKEADEAVDIYCNLSLHLANLINNLIEKSATPEAIHAEMERLGYQYEELMRLQEMLAALRDANKLTDKQIKKIDEAEERNGELMVKGFEMFNVKFPNASITPDEKMDFDGEFDDFDAEYFGLDNMTKEELDDLMELIADPDEPGDFDF